MLLDLISSDNYVNFNIKIAHVIGLSSAVYINELININRKALRKDKITDGFVSINRDYMQQRTTLSIEEQLTIDKKLSKIKVIEVQENFPDNLKINLDILAELIVEDDIQVLQKVGKATTIKSITSNTTKVSARQRVIQGLKSSVKCNNTELEEAYRAWIDGVYANPKGFLSNRAITIFQRGVDDFAKGDLDLALKIIDIATVNGYRDCQWAINLFNKDYAKNYYIQHPAVVGNSATLPPRAVLGNEVF